MNEAQCHDNILKYYRYLISTEYYFLLYKEYVICNSYSFCILIALILLVLATNLIRLKGYKY